LDIGCGTGNLTIKETTLFKQVVGIDISKDMLQALMGKTREKFRKKINLVRGDVENLPFRNNIFDFVSAYSVLHHLPALPTALREAFRVLNSTGVIYIDHEPNTRKRVIADKLYALAGKIKRIKIKKLFARDPILREAYQIYLSLSYSKTDIHIGFTPRILVKMLSQSGFHNSEINFHYYFSSGLSFLPKPFFYIAIVGAFLDVCPIIKNMSDVLVIMASRKEKSNQEL